MHSRFLVRFFATVLLLLTASNAGAQSGSRVHDVEQFRGYSASRAVFENTQRAPLWCWAACIQMCLRANGIPAVQEQVVTQNYGGLVNRGAVSLEQIGLNLVVDYHTPDGLIQVRPQLFKRRLNSQEVKRYIRDDKIIIAAIGEGNQFTTPQHVVVIYGYRESPGTPLLMRIFDPWPQQQSQFHEFPIDYAWKWEQSIVVEARRTNRGDRGEPRCSICAGSDWRECSRCDGTARLACTSCRGAGGFVCNNCDYRGLVPCSTCGGAGVQRCVYGPCGYCGYSGAVRCNALCANGAFSCPTCGGSKQLICRRCNGQRARPCSCGNGRVRCDHRD